MLSLWLDRPPEQGEELTRYGRYVVAMRTKATVCDRCGERYFDRETVQLFDETRQPGPARGE